MNTYARISEGVAVEVWADGGLGIAPADVFIPGLAQQFEPVPPSVTVGWTRVSGEWIAPAPSAVVADQKITRLAFLSRFTDAEAVAIDLASIGATVQAATMRRYMSKVNAANFIDLSREDTRAGVIALESGGVLAAGRAVEILDAPLQEHEVAQ